MTTIAATLNQTTKRLLATSDSARLDAELLLCHTLGWSRAQLLARYNETLTADSSLRCQQFIQRRQQGEPVSYIIGRREFWSLDFHVNEHTLIPRPETELLIELALALSKIPVHARVADLGTGSGAIAIALASERPHWHITASDISADALTAAKMNALANKTLNVRFCQGDWCRALNNETYDLIVSNPPYVASNDPHLSSGDVRFEPASALSAADNGFAALFTIAKQSREALNKNACLLLEHGYDQQSMLIQQLDKLGYRDIEGHRDYSGQTRAVSARWHG